MQKNKDVFLFDTNALLSNPNYVCELENVIIPYIVLQELDKIKTESETDRGRKARRAVRVLKTCENVRYVNNPVRLPSDNNDDVIIKCASENNSVLVTGDFLTQLKAKSKNIEFLDISDTVKSDLYKGYKTINVSNQEIARLYENPSENKYGLFVNQYLILNDENGLTIDKFRWTGTEYVRLKQPNIKRFKAKNELQECALDLLNNKDIPIKIIAGNYGSGKTLLSVKVALHEVLDKGNYGKILIVRNPLGSGESIGYLKGTKEDKTNDFFNPIIQHLEGGEQEAFYMEQRGQLAKEIPYFMKGLSIENTFIICDEAEDLDVKLIKLIGTRLGEDSCVVFAGDYAQAESKYAMNNGLIRAIEKLKGNPLVGIVILNEDVRSNASKVFADLM